MPQTAVYFFQDPAGTAPVIEWLKKLRKKDKKAYAKCAAAIELLREHGHELRRPQVGFLRDGVLELRARKGRVNYRILYFYHGRNVAILAHSLTKEREVPPAEIDRVIERKRQFEDDPDTHIYKGEIT